MTTAAKKEDASVDDLFTEIKKLGEEKEAAEKSLAEAQKQLATCGEERSKLQTELTELKKPKPMATPSDLQKALRDKVIVAWGQGIRCNQCGGEWPVGEAEAHSRKYPCLAELAAAPKAPAPAHHPGP